MKAIYRILSWVALVTFLLYWVAIFIFTMVPKLLSANFPVFRKNFGGSWRLFTPPHAYNHRLYFVVRDLHPPSRLDTIEVLENISLLKQEKAPFNQKENIIDHLVNNNVAALVKTVWANKKMPGENSPGNGDSAYVARTIADVVNNSDYLVYLATIDNYGKLVIKEKGIDPRGKELKIVIKRKMIPPLRNKDERLYLPPEILVFETPYKPIDP